MSTATKNKKKGKNKPSGKKHGAKRKGGKLAPMAERADRHKLYQEAVQNVEDEIDFVDERFEAMRGRKAETLREDFCGTANTACEWVRRRKTNRAIGVDLDNDVLQWGRDNNIGKLDEEDANRVTLLNEDVLTVRTEPVDVLLAMNFSYWLFQERKTLLNYFKSVRAALKDDGVFFCDAYGGWDAHRTITEARDCDRFEYVWDQDEFDPISHRMKCFIHFKFPDGSKMKKAFSYEWRLWSLPELRELLAEAGFSKVTIYWEGADEDGDGNGEFEPVTEAESDPGWICYLVAEK